MLVILATIQLFTFGFTADVEVWPKNVDDFLHSTHGEVFVEGKNVRLVGGYELLMTAMTKENAIRLFNAESGSALIKYHRVEAFVHFKAVEIGLTGGKVAAHMFNHRWQFWYDNKQRREISDVPTIGYYQGIRLYVRHPNFEVHSPPILWSFPTLGYPIITTAVRYKIGKISAKVRFSGPYRVPYEDVSYVPVIDSEIAYDWGIHPFIRFGRVNVPLTIETRMRRPRLAFGIRLTAKG